MDYKNLKRVLGRHLNEDKKSDENTDARPSLGDGALPSFKVEDAEVLAKINSFLRAFSIERHPDAKHALVLLRTKLNTIGLDFPYDGRRNLDSKESFSLTQFGGRSGMNDQGKYVTDDGIAHRMGGKGLDLHIEITPIDDNEGPFYIHPQIKPCAAAQKFEFEPQSGASAKTFKSSN